MSMYMYPCDCVFVIYIIIIDNNSCLLIAYILLSYYCMLNIMYHNPVISFFI